MTDTKCYICGHALEEHAPYVVWHTGWDGCEECDRDYERGVSLCPVCIDALGYMGHDVGWEHVSARPAVWGSRELGI